jgi:2'-5' RNA ligase
MRLFVAVEVSDELRAWASRVRRTIDRAKPVAASGLRWVAPDQMHLTLRFIGEVEPVRTSAIREVLAAGLSSSAFDIEVAGLHWLPPAGRPRVLVSEVGRGRERLQALRTDVDAILEQVAGVAPEDRPLLAHVTLARVRDRTASAVASARSDIVKACGDSPAIRVGVRRLTLFESHLSPHGPRYTEIAAAPLVARGNP